MKRLLTSTVLLVALLFSGAGCSSFSKSARQQRAYQKYVRKSSVTRNRQQMKFRTTKPVIPRAPEASEPIESVETGPEAMASASSE
jgi:hypothetical protein